jgi:hypothetical protein
MEASQQEFHIKKTLQAQRSVCGLQKTSSQQPPSLHECTEYCNKEQMIGLGSSPCACSPFQDAPHPLAGNTLLQKLPEMQENRFA